MNEVGLTSLENFPKLEELGIVRNKITFYYYFNYLIICIVGTRQE